MNKWFGIGAVNALLAVVLGAFGAHALKGRLSEDMLNVYHTGVQYHMTHALGLLALALFADRLGDGAATVKKAACFLLAGIVLFSGSLYALSLSGISALGIITPFGGVCFLIGWAMAAYAAWKRK